ncbi:EAL domain-containing protein [Lederbergia citri]|uniref:EAL domain-containing protein n=1 Tax=Lederbergia citri TaxID=2833580 RepID=A0A942TGR6_9BACI|nr:EAL domain-containing protein [Lederbergia citri]MBS4197756.1 EAL domain-containing protein [Lederbergia citri]
MGIISVLAGKRKEMNGKNYYSLFGSGRLLNETTFLTLFENHPDSVFALSVYGEPIYFNKTVIEKFGLTDQELENELKKYIKERNKKNSKYFKLALKGNAQKFQTYISCKNINKLKMDVTYLPILNHDMKVIGVYAIAKDITVKIEHEEEIEKIKTSLELSQQIGKIGSWDYDVLKDEIYWSDYLFELTGREKNNNHVTNLNEGLQFVHPDDCDRYKKTLNQALEESKGYSIEYRIIRKDLTLIYVSEEVEMVFDTTGSPIRLLGMTKDVTKRKLVENKLQESEQRLEHIYENLSLGIRSFDVLKQENILITPGIEDITGYPPEYFYKREAWDSIIHPDDLHDYLNEYSNTAEGRSFNIQYRICHKNGQIIWVQDKTIPEIDEKGNVVRVDGFVSDITEQKEYEKLIQYLAFHDHLTELPNRKLFDEKITSLYSKRNKESFSILYVDMDRFRNINNTLGHVIGDKLLHQFGQRVQKLLTEKSLFARIGGDEFGILLWGYMEKDYPESIAKMIIDSLKQPFMVDDFELFITASVGISTSSSDGVTFEELTKYADIALNRAKTNGKNNFQIYSPTLDIPSFKQYELERDLRKAIDNDQLLIHFQPRVEASTGKIVSAEALVRWQHPVWGLVSPGEFLPLAEENGFIIDIGDWVLEKVCQYIAEWKRVRLPIVPISINITAQRFLRNDWKSTIISILKETNVDPTLIEFEITETTIIQNEKLVESALKFLKELGIKVALDDFGTGYSSLSHIKNLSIDTIKIDQSFVSQITQTPNVEIIIKSIIFMANALNMNVVAEGVETLEQLAFLKQQECTEIQGYIFSKPIPEEEFQDLLIRFILRPITRSKKPKIKDRRKFFRIELLSPLKANLTLTCIQGREVNLGRTEALIEDIGPGGLRFLSAIHLPVRPDITYKFVMIILGEKLELYGHITWKKEVKDIFQYGLEFTIDEKERDSLIKILNNFSLQLKNQAFPPECNFISEDKITYLKKLKATG